MLRQRGTEAHGKREKRDSHRHTHTHTRDTQTLTDTHTDAHTQTHTDTDTDTHTHTHKPEKGCVLALRVQTVSCQQRPMGAACGYG